MGLGNMLLLSQVTGYTVAFLLSLCIIVPVSIHIDSFNGHCLLYSGGTFRESDGAFLPSWASPGFCSFDLFVGIILLMSSVIQLCRFSVFLYNGIDSSFLSAFLDTVINILLMVFVFVSAIITTGGFRAWCKAVMTRFPSCEDASLMQIDQDDHIDTEGFYIQIGTAQFGAWSSWVCWVFLTVLSTRKLCIYHEQENIMVSMARERQRLVSSASSSSYTFADA